MLRDIADIGAGLAAIGASRNGQTVRTALLGRRRTALPGSPDLNPIEQVFASF